MTLLPSRVSVRTSALVLVQRCARGTLLSGTSYVEGIIVPLKQHTQRKGIQGLYRRGTVWGPDPCDNGTPHHPSKGAKVEARAVFERDFKTGESQGRGVKVFERVHSHLNKSTSRTSVRPTMWGGVPHSNPPDPTPSLARVQCSRGHCVYDDPVPGTNLLVTGTSTAYRKGGRRR